MVVEDGRVRVPASNQWRELLARWQAVASAAFEVWGQMMRLRTRDSSICRPPIEVPSASPATRIAAKQDGFIVDVGAIHFGRATLHAVVNRRQWDWVENALQAGGEVPLHFRLLFDAEALEETDQRRAIIDGAVAAETFIKGMVSSEHLQGLPENIRSFVERANITKLIDFFVASLSPGDQSTFKTLKIQRLIDVRNAVMHSGRSDLKDGECRALLAGVRELFELKPSG